MIVRMNAPSRASILAKQKAGILLVHQVGVKSFSRTSQKVSIDLANETENRLLKSGKDMKLFIRLKVVQLFKIVEEESGEETIWETQTTAFIYIQVCFSTLHTLHRRGVNGEQVNR